jgi:copper resistance protein D
MQHWLARVVCCAALLAAIFAFGKMFAVAGRMSGDVVGALHRETLLTVVFGTRFGKVWQAQAALSLLLAAVLPVALTFARQRACYVGTLLTSGGLLVGLASVGHAMMVSGTSGALLANHALHVMAAAAWLGGLLPLALSSPRRVAMYLVPGHPRRAGAWGVFRRWASSRSPCSCSPVSAMPHF